MSDESELSVHLLRVDSVANCGAMSPVLGIFHFVINGWRLEPILVLKKADGSYLSLPLLGLATQRDPERGITEYEYLADTPDPASIQEQIDIEVDCYQDRIEVGHLRREAVGDSR